jgi:hypothetical protein
MRNVSQFLKTRVNSSRFTNNTQRVLHRLLTANGDWISRDELNRVARSASARVRDLRKVQFGNINVQCSSATALGRVGNHNTFYYRINPRNVTIRQANSVFGS